MAVAAVKLTDTLKNCDLIQKQIDRFKFGIFLILFSAQYARINLPRKRFLRN